MEKNANHAIVFGASGLIGWAVVDQLLRSYPEASRFSKITAITNRSVKFCDSFWPPPNPTQPKLQLVSGIDLSQGDGTALAERLKEAVDDVENVTHVYYLVFTAVPDAIDEVAVNAQMFRNVVDALDLLSPKLEFVAWPGGTRGYGIYAPNGTFTPPLTEDMVKNLPADYEKTVVYPAHRAMPTAASEGKKWTWCEVCPDAIIGFTPNGSQFSLSLHWAQYLTLYAHNHVIRARTEESSSNATVEVPFPGNKAGANSLFTPVSASTIARFMIYASLHPETCGNGQLFNIADHATPCTYGEIWPRLAAWFGLVGTNPAAASTGEGGKAAGLKVGELPVDRTASLTPGDYIVAHKDDFIQQGRENAVTGGVGAGSRQLDSVGYWLTFDRQMSIERLRETGLEGDRDPVEGWFDAFSLFRKAGLIL